MSLKIARLIVLGLSLAATANAAKMRHVLACVDDGPLSENEIGADFTPAGLIFKNAAGTSASLGREAADKDSSLGSIAETPAGVTFTFGGKKVRLSDGKYRDSPTSISRSRLSMSYGEGSLPALSPGWVYTFAVYDSGTDQIKLSYSSNLTPPGEPHRYVGSFYVEKNWICESSPLEDECSSNPPCLGTSSCDANYGRYTGVQLERVGNVYRYQIYKDVPSCSGGKCPIANINQLAKRVYMSFGHWSGDSGVQYGSVIRYFPPKTRAWIPVPEGGVAMVPLTEWDGVLSGHEEDLSIYE